MAEMLRVVAHSSAAAARSYYTQGLRREDYYSEHQEVVGKWFGKAAALLGLTGQVTPEAFERLVENRHPVTGERLTPRTDRDRTVGYDLNFHAPKSLSVLYALTKDADIVEAFRSAVAETMREIEWQTATRVRGAGRNFDRVTGNLAWAEFVHFTARPVGGVPDPHLHVHCFAFNATHDAVEGRWKAAKFREIKQDAPYSEAVFHSTLSAKIAALGYGIEKTKTGWEVAGITRDVIDQFSKRTAQVERLASERGITDPKAKDALGGESREGKRYGITEAELRKLWVDRLTDDQRATVAAVRNSRGSGVAPVAARDAAKACDYASEKLFAKASVVPQKGLVREAVLFGLGHISPEQVWTEFGRRGMLTRQVGKVTYCTSLAVLAEEVSLINFVRSGRGQCAAFHPSIRLPESQLSAEQKAAVRHILTSHDQVIALRGAAGVGKTTLMRTAVDMIEAGGKRVFAFAPSASASRGTLRAEGFGEAETVAQLLTNRKLQERTRGQVIWIDEAGLLGIRDMWQIMKIAGKSTRVILTGDAGQHAPVARGDAFRLLQKFAGLKIAQVTKVRRQEVEDYRRAVEAFSKGDLRTGMRRLDELGAIIEVSDAGERYRTLAMDFVELSRKGSAPLVVSPTHAESARVTDAIREARKATGQLQGERSFTRLHNLQWEEADRKQAENYRPGLVVQFHQNAKGIQRADMFRVIRSAAGTVAAKDANGREIVLPLAEAARFQVFEERQIHLARGDSIRITRNAKTSHGGRLNNGDVHTIENFIRGGGITLKNGAVLDSGFGHLAHGYCQTSHSAQSKSVRDVLIAQSGESFLASSREQFYVSVSRGKQSIRIYTDSRSGLEAAVAGSSTRRSGVELVGMTNAEVASLMSTELSGKQWRESIQSRKAEDQTQQFVANLMRSRQQSGQQKSGGMSWRGYVEMRRQIAGQDGKSRAKVGPTAQKARVEIQNRGRSFLRPTELSAGTTAKMETAKAKSPPTESVATETNNSRMERLHESASKHFRKIADRVGEAAKKITASRRPTGTLPESNVAQISDHRRKQKVVEGGAATKNQTKVQAKIQPAVQVPRRGK